MDDNLPTQKIGKKIFYDQEMVKKGLVEISAAPNRPFWGGVSQIFSYRTNGVPKHLTKLFGVEQTIVRLGDGS